MKTSVYLLEKDRILADNIKKRFLIETTGELKGAGDDAGTSYVEIQRIKPDMLIFGYPMNFTPEQLVAAMSAVNPNMKYIALVENGFIPQAEELRRAGIQNIIQKPFDIESLMKIVSNESIQTQNPFGNNPFGNNPVANAQPVNPFSSQTIQQQLNPYKIQVHQQEFNQPPNVGPVPRQEFIPQQQQPYGNMQNPQDLFQSTTPISQSFKTFKQTQIAIHCPKGGVGKTSVSINLATLLSAVKIGKQSLNVLLVDMDWAFGDVCINLAMQPRPNIMNWVNDIKSRRALNENADMNFTQAQIDNYLITYKTGLKILAAPASHNDNLNIPDDAAKIIIDNLKKNCNYDVVIFDCGNNVETHTLETLLSVHSVYEVVTMDMSAIQDLKNLTSTLKSISFPMDKIKLIVNRIPKTERGFDIDTISEALELKVAAIVPENEKVRVQNNLGEPLVLSKTTNSFSEAIKQTANTVLGNNIFTKGTQKNNTQEKKSGGFFRKIFK